VNTASIAVGFEPGVAHLDPHAWDALVGDGSPFLEHAWLAALEHSGSVGEGTGWTPTIACARLGDTLVGAVPLYLKAHSFGEYVYDWAWADAAAQIGTRYYPKLVATSPLSPVAGARLLTSPALDPAARARVAAALVDATLALAAETGVSGLHFLFPTAEEAEALRQRGMFVRTAFQYHWSNDGYASFDDYLARFESKRRRELRRERRRLAEAGYRVEPTPGHRLTATDRDALYRFYASTCAKHTFGRPYLSRAFFDEVCDTVPHRILMMRALDPDGALVAGTFNVTKGDRLYGRYWGCDVEVPHLHFETCYYRTIEHAIDTGVAVMEPGAGGDHKYARGFNPVVTWSAHWIAHPVLARAIERHVARERDAVDAWVERLTAESPLRKR